MPGIRVCAVLVLVLVLGNVALADDADLTDEAGLDDGAAPAAEVDAALGAGVVGASPMSAVDAAVRLTWVDADVALGARVRMVGDDFVRADWDEVGDWIAVIRRFTWRGEETRLDGAEGWRGALVVGPLVAARLGDGAVIDGFVGGALADRRATGAHARLTRASTEIEALAGDLGRATLFAAGARADAGPVDVGGVIAVDPSAPVHDDAGMIETTPLVAISASASWPGARGASRGALALDATYEPTLGAGVAAIAHGTTSAGDRALIHGRIEVGVGTGGYVAAPFGPLYLRDRDVASPEGEMTGETLIDRARAGGLGGVGGAASITVDADGLGSGTAGARWRPGLGAELLARAALPALRGTQAAALVAWAPGDRDALVFGAEARAWLGDRLWSALEAQRQYGAGDDPGLHAERAVWQVSAWFGWTPSTD